MDNTDYTQMSDEEVQRDLDLLRTDDLTRCDIVADYTFKGDGSTGLSTIANSLVDFIRRTIGDPGADVRVKGGEKDGVPVYMTSITSASVDKRTAYDALKNADSEQFPLINLAISQDNVYEENVEQ